MNPIFRAIYAATPMSFRVRFGRAWKTRSRINHLRLNQTTVNQRLADANLFFLLGSGRCGTLLISRMLNQAPDAVVLHEPHRHCDLTVRPDCRLDPAKALAYATQFRKDEIFKKIREKNVKTYGEVSSPLRCLGGALKTTLPNAKFFILVRDGRGTVRSAMNRQAPRKGSENHQPPEPLPDDHPHVDNWPNMDTFQQTCWWWLDCYRMLLDHLPDAPIVQLEKISTDYNYLDEKILTPLNLKLTRTQYEASMAKRSANAAKDYTIPHYNDWDEDRRKKFDAICGPMMETLGYQRHW